MRLENLVRHFAVEVLPKAETAGRGQRKLTSLCWPIIVASMQGWAIIIGLPVIR